MSKPHILKPRGVASKTSFGRPRVDAEKVVSSWLQLADLIDHRSDRRYLFRGVSKASHKLIPKIGRPDSRKSARTGKLLAYSRDGERKMVEAFRRAASPYLRTPELKMIDVLAVGQHHGLPTRLLDWSESPLVAAFFAAERAGIDDEPPAIYVVRDLPLYDPNRHVFKQKSPVVLYRPPHISARIPAQNGVFTVHRNPHKEEFLPDHVEKWILQKGRQTFWLKQILATCGVNRASLFPDLDGLAEYMGWRYKWDKF